MKTFLSMKKKTQRKLDHYFLDSSWGPVKRPWVGKPFPADVERLIYPLRAGKKKKKRRHLSTREVENNYFFLYAASESKLIYLTY